MAMNRRRTLITSPLDWFLSANPVPPPAIPVLAERGGTQLKTPRPLLVVDTREQNPFDFSRFQGWFSGIERRALKLGDYSIAGLEDLCVVERTAFVARLRRMAEYPHCLLVVTAALSQVKSPYPHSAVNPNQIAQSLIAVLAGLGITFICTETHEMGEEILASYLYQVHLYHWLEENGFGSTLTEGDL